MVKLKIDNREVEVTERTVLMEVDPGNGDRGTFHVLLEGCGAFYFLHGLCGEGSEKRKDHSFLLPEGRGGDGYYLDG